jgi:hypothetical protein
MKSPAPITATLPCLRSIFSPFQAYRMSPKLGSILEPVKPGLCCWRLRALIPVRPRTRKHPDGARINRLRAHRAGQHGIELMTAGQVLMKQRTTGFSGSVDIAPVHDAHHHRVQIAPLLGQPVFVPDRPVTIRHFLQHPGLNQLAQPIRQDVAGDTKPRLEIIEPANAQEAIPQDQQGPPIADDRNGSRYGASFIG